MLYNFKMALEKSIDSDREWETFLQHQEMIPLFGSFSTLEIPDYRTSRVKSGGSDLLLGAQA